MIAQGIVYRCANSKSGGYHKFYIVNAIFVYVGLGFVREKIDYRVLHRIDINT